MSRRGTLLIDLDDTLLINPTATFLPPFMRGMLKTLAPLGTQNAVGQAFLSASKIMLANVDPLVTLGEAFLQHFSKETGVAPDQLEVLTRSFYSGSYRSLREHVSPMPGAVEFVGWALADGWDIAIATNPLYPLEGIQQRLEWAGFDPEYQHEFRWITSLERSHFAKPHPAYYCEILAHLGWPEGPVVMVGNDPELDAAPTAQLGLANFLYNPDVVAGDSHLEARASQGGFDQLKHWLSTGNRARLAWSNDNRLMTIAGLRSTPAVLDSISRPLEDPIWRLQPRPNAWSLAELVHHLWQVDERVNLERIDHFSAVVNPFIAATDTDSWSIELPLGQNGADILNQWGNTRLQLLKRLNQLNDKQWAAQARHAIFGPTSLGDLMAISADHDRLHVRQALRWVQQFSENSVSLAPKSG